MTKLREYIADVERIIEVYGDADLSEAAISALHGLRDRMAADAPIPYTLTDAGRKAIGGGDA